jgi:GMP synthase (glutamine-hydrolysing)
MTTVRAIQHVGPEGLGRIASALAASQIDVIVTRVDRGEAVPDDVDDAHALVVMGGPMSVYEANRHAHLRDELRLLERALRRGVPVLGVCLGAQLLAAALGARAYAAPEKEIGWLPVMGTESTAEGAGDPLFAAVPGIFTALHWHGDVFDLPHGALSLARSAATEHQAFRWGRHAYGVLFHLEATDPQVRAMATHFADELTAARVDVAALLAETPAHTRQSESLAASFFGAWGAAVTSA